MAKQTVETTDNLNEGRAKINENFTELYTGRTATSWTPTVTGFSGTPTVSRSTYFLFGKLMFIQLIVTGTSNATTFTITIPFNAAGNGGYPVQVDDNGTGSIGRLNLAAGTATCTIFSNGHNGAFTSSGSKALRAFIAIEIE